MCAASARPLRLRALRFETCEDRIVLSGQPAADFFLDDALPYQPQDTLDQIELALADVHDEYGVTYAQDAFGFNGSGQTVAVIDSGIAYDHFALGGGLGAGYRVVGGRDFTEENDADPYDDGPAGFHGTHVAGIVGSDDANYPGVAPAVDLVALRVFNDQGLGYFSWVEKALGWVHEHRNDFEHPITTVTLSLGSNWNSDRPPAWATLEDEFATLNQDGIFIAVAAGNDYTSYRTDGLSYPAASPYVVPVASVGDNGNISWFSQRHDRVLAAPGENITSTVPDYLFSFDNVPNDYASASGTSMAAPYLAGASVLVREALEFVGTAGITQEMIYGYLRSEADLVYDTQTRQSYHRIDIRATLDAIMPADEYGSTAATAHGFGTLYDQLTESGIIASLNDVDFFRFTAGSSGVATVSVDASGELVPDMTLPGGAQQTSNGVFEFDVVAGREYVFGIGSAEGIGRYTTQIEVSSSVVDLGVVDVAEFDAQSTAGDQSYRFTAARQGLVTIEAFLAQKSQNVVIRVTDSRGVLVAEASASGATAQLDFVAKAGDSYVMTVAGAGDGAHYRITNVFEGVNASLEITVDDFTGDGRADVLGRSAAGHWWLARGTDNGYLSQYAGQWNTRAKWTEVVVDDFDGDGRRDVLGRTISGQWWVSLGGGTTARSRFAGRWSTKVEWVDVKIGDFTGDGVDDVFGRNADGRWWLADRYTSRWTAQFRGNWGRLHVWTDVFSGDFNGDGQLDVIGRTQTGTWFLAQNTGDRFINRGWGKWNPSAGWSDVMVADFTGDGLPDVVGRTANGRWYVGENTGTRFTNRWWGGWNRSTTWSDVMTGDFTGDDLPDIVGRNSAGRWYLAENTGTRFVNRQWGSWSQSTTLSDVIAEDFTGDGLLDLAGRAASGEWYLSENTGAGFVNVLWESWEASHAAPRDAVGPATQAAVVPAAGGMHSFDRWLESDEGSRVAGRLLNTLDPTTGWGSMSRWALR
jgi:subtilisin family serine protease